jgi:polar amino acid transport system permease protein
MRTFGFPEFLFILEAAKWTLALSAIAFVGGAILGLAIALMRTVGIDVGARRVDHLHPDLPGHAAAAAAVPGLLRRAGAGAGHQPVGGGRRRAHPEQRAFLGEIWRGCIEAIPRGQWEAAEALSLKYSARMRDVVLPQAFKIALAPTVGYVVQIIKGTSLAAIIGFVEVTRAGQIINNATFQPLIVFSVVAAIYFVICWPLSLLAARMERSAPGPRALIARLMAR